MAANPYVQGWREWDERYADLVLGKRNWQIAAGCSLLITLVLAVGIVWLALPSRYLPVEYIPVPVPLSCRPAGRGVRGEVRRAGGGRACAAKLC
jgi:hypothetical protein